LQLSTGEHCSPLQGPDFKTAIVVTFAAQDIPRVSHEKMGKLKYGNIKRLQK
jgi:hypothetical protein